MASLKRFRKTTKVEKEVLRSKGETAANRPNGALNFA